MSFFVVGARAKTMSFNKSQKNKQTKIDRGSVVAMLQVHYTSNPFLRESSMQKRHTLRW